MSRKIPKNIQSFFAGEVGVAQGISSRSKKAIAACSTEGLK
jgi:hypothetical protein